MQETWLGYIKISRKLSGICGAHSNAALLVDYFVFSHDLFTLQFQYPMKGFLVKFVNLDNHVTKHLYVY